MIREVMLARCILFISIISLALTIMRDLEFIQSVFLLYILIGLLALLIFLVVQFRLDIYKSKLFIDSSGNDDLRKKINKSVQVILVFSIIAEAFLLLLVTHAFSLTKISWLLGIIGMIVAYCFFLLQWVISLRNAVKAKK